MNRLTKVASTGVLSVALAASIASPAYAWEPKGQITKSVQNVTANGAVQDANDAAQAVAAKQGDILNYVIVVKNVAPAASKQYNDMAFTRVTDTLPAGVELVSTPGSREVTADMGTITPGNAKQVSFQVKVTATTNGAVIDNKACFTADSVVKDNPQKGCDSAVVKVSVPETPVTPGPQPPAVTPPAPQQPPALPNTGVGSTAIVAGLTATLLGYAAYVLRLKRRVA